jgi:hypothetical protein
MKVKKSATTVLQTISQLRSKLMGKSLFSACVAFVIAVGAVGIVPQANAASNDSIVFNMVRSAGAASCLKTTARGRVTLSDLGPVQNMHVEVFDLPAKTDFTLFVITTPTAPFVPAWYQGDVTTNSEGRGVVDVTGIFSDETFILNPGPVAVQTSHLGMWFANPSDAVNAGCAGTVTPFDGDHNAGIQVLNTSNFPNASGPLQQIR